MWNQFLTKYYTPCNHNIKPYPKPNPDSIQNPDSLRQTINLPYSRPRI